MEYLGLELKTRLEDKLAEIEKKLNAPVEGVYHHYLKGKEDAIKEALAIAKDVVEYHEQELDGGDYVCTDE